MSNTFMIIALYYQYLQGSPLIVTLSYLCYMVGVKSNVKELINLELRAPKDNRPQIDKIIELYEYRKIQNFKTAEKCKSLVS